MNSWRFLKATFVSMASCGLLIPQLELFAAGPNQAVKQRKTAQEPAIIDIAMAAGGIVTGKVMDLQNKELQGVVVSVRQSDREVATAVTDKTGVFAVENLRGGSYHVVAANGHGWFRFWAPNTAPPAAHRKVLIVSGAVIIRAQNVVDRNVPSSGVFGNVDVITLGVLGAAFTGLSFAIYNYTEIDALKEANDRLPATP